MRWASLVVLVACGGGSTAPPDASLRPKYGDGILTPRGGTITGVAAGTGLSGGGTAGSVTLNVANTAVAAGSYSNSTITVNAQGQVTAASNGAAPVTSGGLGTNTDIAIFTGTSTVGNYGGSSPSACTAGNAVTRAIMSPSGALTLTCDSAGITNSAGANVLMKSDGTNAVASSVSDNGTTVSTGESLSVAGLITGNAGAHWDTSTSDGAAPETDWIGRNGDWVAGVDVANTTPARDFVSTGRRGSYSFEDGVCNGTTTLTSAAQGGFSSILVGKTIAGTGIAGGTTITAVASATSATLSNTCTTGTALRFTITDGATYDIAYWKHRGSLAPTLGLGVTPPDGSYRLQVTGSDSEATMGGIGVRVAPGETADALNVHDSAPNTLWAVKNNGHMIGSTFFSGPVTMDGFATSGAVLAMQPSDESNSYGFLYSCPHGGGSSMCFKDFSTATNVWEADAGGNLYALHGFTGDGTITSTGLLTASDGLTSTAGTTSLGTTNVSGTSTFSAPIVSTASSSSALRQEYFGTDTQGNTDNANGPEWRVGLNLTGRRSLMLVDSAANTLNATNTGLDFTIGATLGAAINAISTNWGVAQPLTINASALTLAPATTLSSTLGVTGASTFSSTITVKNGGGIVLGDSTHTGHVTDVDGSARPTLSGCGTSPTIFGNDASGEITIGTTGTGCTITFNVAYTSPSCVVTAQNGTAPQYRMATGATLALLTGTAGAKYDYECRDH